MSQSIVSNEFLLKAVRGDMFPSPPPRSGPFALSAAGALEHLVEQAGWKVTASNVVDCTFEYPYLETHWRAQKSAGPLQAALKTLGETQLRAAVEEAIKPFQTGMGGVQLQNRFRVITATV